MCKYNSFRRRKSFVFSLLKKKEIKKTNRTHSLKRGVQTASREGKQGQHQVSPSTTKGNDCLAAERGVGRGKSHSKHCRTCGRGEHGTAGSMQRVEAHAVWLGKGIISVSKDMRILFGQCAHLRKKGIMAQRDSCRGGCKARRSEHARQRERAQKSAQSHLSNYTDTDVLQATYLGCFGLRVSVICVLFLNKPLLRLSEKTEPEST